MEKESVILIRDRFKEQGAKVLIVVADNNEWFRNLNEFMIWDDSNEILWSLSINTDGATQPEAPFNVRATTYENIQYIKADFDKFGVTDLLNTLPLQSNQLNYITKTFLDKVNPQRLGDIDNRPDVP